MNENELYEEYDGICVPEDEYNYLVENGFINGDLQDMFVGSFLAPKDDYCRSDNELILNIKKFLSRTGAIFIQDTRAKGVLVESRAFFFFNEFLVIVPINAIQEVTPYDEDTVEVRYTKSKKKPVCIPIKNIKEFYHPDINNNKKDCSMLILYRNGERKSDILILGGDAEQYSDAIYEYNEYPEVLERLNNRLDNAIDFMLMEDMLMDSFDKIPAGTFKYIKYETVSSEDFTMMNTILEYVEHLKLDTELYNIIDDYMDVIENYLMYKDEYENAEREYNNASFFKKGYWRKEVENKKYLMEQSELKTEVEAMRVIEDIISWVDNTSKKLRNKESSSNS